MGKLFLILLRQLFLSNCLVAADLARSPQRLDCTRLLGSERRSTWRMITTSGTARGSNLAHWVYSLFLLHGSNMLISRYIPLGTFSCNVESN
jgi:hypothetical protein